jgi:hypothetical protein
VRRILSLTLLLLFSLPLISPLLALGQSSDSQLPACCRRNGAHRCSMSPDQLAALNHGQHFTTAKMKCPMFPQSVAPSHHETSAISLSAILFAAVHAHPAQFPQVEAWARVALEGARLKRGPPAVRLS